MVELTVKYAEFGVCRAADNVTFAGLARQTDGRYLAVVLHFGQHRRERARYICTVMVRVRRKGLSLAIPMA